jgi:oligopeptidase B
MNKKNSFQDFHACANYMVDHKYAHHSKLAAWGMSAGGLLVGATLSMYPSLFCTAILEVIFSISKSTLNSPISVGEKLMWK